ncbi:methyl-accepting chemotaxis protein [Nitrospirillum amazonense]|uniref:Methyl-accepting chemotaxis protein n=1 Tax=Nitrospirillum amazonense TaxID=28077 RepID=A0A560FM98_9PROT|nr:nitrate- and nitrite sensing domain-containing protein [Nitrospirillum amazonense]TWB22690.1 methyl-accepting chemotaxis protein [Nitrospirillum amazonense]
MTRFRIVHRVVLALLVPSLGLLLAAALILAEKQATVSQMRTLSRLTQLATTVGDLVHEMQRERGASAVFLGSKGAQLQRELPEQRARTDQRRQALELALKNDATAPTGGALAQILADATRRLAQLDEMRRKIDGLQIPAAESSAYFTATILRQLDVDIEISKSVTNPSVARVLSTYVNFTQAKERAGEERANGAAAFAAGKFDITQYRRFLGTLAEEATYFRLFAASASPEDQAFLDRTVTGEAVSEVERMRKVAVETAPGDALGSIDGAYWFKTATARIDMMKTVEDYLARNLLAQGDRVRDEAQGVLWAALAATLVLFGVTGVLSTVIVRDITRPVAGMTDAMTRLAGGDQSVDVPGISRRDEIGDMAAAVQVFKRKMTEAERLRAEQEAMERRAEDEKRTAMTKLADEFEASVRGVVGTVSSASAQLQSTAQSMSFTAAQTSQRSTAVAAAAEQASANVQTVASAAAELSSSIGEISRHVVESTRIASQAVTDAGRTNAQVQALASAAQKIDDVVKLINGIAGQTNLLALNATIEAARAGEAGKGFAVVASEVKLLATQTAKATEDISAQVKAIQQATADSVQAIDGITGTITRINEIATTVASAVEEQGAATQEIARSVQQASSGTAEVATNITAVTQAAGETGAASSQVLTAAADLSRQSDALRAQVDAFISKVRAA